MAAPFVPSPLDCIGGKRFAFYPPIQQAGPNLWLLGSRSRAEVEAVNVETGAKIWIDRQYIGAVSDQYSFPTVGLRKSLELRNGRIEPTIKRVIEMPQAVDNCFAVRPVNDRPAPVVAIRLEDGKKSSVASKVFVGLAIASLVGALLAAWVSAARHF